jgi:NitT/TauT family transport system ATP-binding protein
VSNEEHITIQGVDVVYETSQRALTAVSNVSLEVAHGDFVSIIGPSGCGKSTLLRVIGGLQAPTAGTVRIDGEAPEAAQRTKQIGFVFQDPSLLPWRSVADNVKLPLQVNRRAGESAAESPEALIDLVGLRDFGSYYPHQLSGGMQQRVALARSLVTAPSLLLMDEPFGALDEITRSAMRFELLRLRQNAEAASCTVVFVTHSIAEAVLLSDRVIVMSPQPGRVVRALDVELSRPRDEAVEESLPFLEYTQELRGLLRERVPA